MKTITIQLSQGDTHALKEMFDKYSGYFGRSGYTYDMVKSVFDRIETIQNTPESKETISDGFGSEWSITCPMCKQDTMHVVRPGKVQCGNCG